MSNHLGAPALPDLPSRLGLLRNDCFGEPGELTIAATNAPPDPTKTRSIYDSFLLLSGYSETLPLAG